MMSDEAVAAILNQYHPLVRHIASKAFHSSSTLDIEDLYQVGDMAVLRAVKAYDPTYGSNIKSFVANAIRNAIFNEAAHFLGVLTVDFRTTNQASYAAKLHESGRSDEEIAVALTEKHGRKFDVDHARDLRMIYMRREYSCVNEDLLVDDMDNDITIKDLLDSVIKNKTDRVIVDNRILGSSTVEQVAAILNTSKKDVYEKEAALKLRIKRAIEDAV